MMDEDVYRELERAYSKKSETLLEDLLIVLQGYDRADLEGIAEYRDAIHPGGWLARMIREYVDVWR